MFTYSRKFVISFVLLSVLGFQNLCGNLLPELFSTKRILSLGLSCWRHNEVLECCIFSKQEILFAYLKTKR